MSSRADIVQALQQAYSERKVCIIRNMLDPVCHTGLPDDIKVFPDASLLGPQPMSLWFTSKRDSGSWGTLATLMSWKPRHKTQTEKFLGSDFRSRCGYDRIVEIGNELWGQDMYEGFNLFLTGDTAQRCWSQAHQDAVHNLMLVCTGKKTWATADLSDDDVRSCTKGFKLKDSLGIDAVHIGLNRTEEDTRVARLFTVNELHAGDLIYVPPLAWHQVESTPQCLAVSVMYRI